MSHASPVRCRAGEARGPDRTGTARRLAALGGVALLAVACGQTGSATTRIDAAEVEVETIVEDIVESVSLQTDEEIGVGTRSSCELVTGGAGGSNTLSLRGSLPDVDDPVGRASAVLVEAGYELIDSEDELGEGVFGRRDGIRITVVVDGPTEQLEIDAATGCRPPPSA